MFSLNLWYESCTDTLVAAVGDYYAICFYRQLKVSTNSNSISNSNSIQCETIRFVIRRLKQLTPYKEQSGSSLG